jgi:hypothetical protein
MDISAQESLVPKVGSVVEHYKGKRYTVLALGHHSETLEPMVVYKALYEDPHFGDGAVWIRPLSMFFEHVQIGDTVQPRFQVISG